MTKKAPAKAPILPKSKAGSVASRIKSSSGAESAEVVGHSKLPKRRQTTTSKEFEERAAKLAQPRSRTASEKSEKKHYGTVGSATYIGEDGKIVDDPSFFHKLRSARGGGFKMASMFDGGGTANVADSDNVQSYNFEFPNDALELPQSRREELRYYRIAYDRDPIINRAINLHTELPLSKLILEKPKCSVETFADFVFDWFQGWANDVQLFEQILHMTREHFLIGEAFAFVEHLDDPDKFPLCPPAKRQMDRKERIRGPISETNNPPEGMDELSTYRWVGKHKASKLLKEAEDLGLINGTSKRLPDLKQALPRIASAIIAKTAELEQMVAKVAAMKTAAPPAPDAGAPAPMMKGPLERITDMRAPGGAPDAAGGEPPAPGAEGADATGGAPGAPGADPMGGDMGGGDPGMGGDMGGGDMGGGLGGAPMGGGGGLGGGMDMGGGEGGEQAQEPRHTQELRRYVKMLERKKELLEELKTLKEEKQREWEVFAHVVNPEYWGPSRIVLLPPDVIEIRRDKRCNAEPTICYRPSVEQKAAYLEDSEVDAKDKEMLESENIVPLNDDPTTGSYVLHFARKKAPFEDHGRSILQCVLRTVIYRDKLRQVQNTLASRNMTPKTLVVAPDAPIQELDALRVHIDEAKADPDYTIVVNYECTWNEIGTDGRILALDSEWAHTSSEIAVGMGFTPEILTGEGFFSGDRIRIELLNTSYLQFREFLQELIETKVFRPIAMRKGFYEMDDDGNPRWIYPKLNFTRLALRDQGDVYDMLFNLYSKGSLPVDIIYEFLNIDPETAKRKLEEDMLTVKDSKFNQILDALYAGLAEVIIKSTDIVDKVTKSLQLKAKDEAEEDGPEGTGEGV